MKIRKILRLIALVLIWLVLGVATLWAAAALYFDVRISWLRIPLAAIYGLGILAVWIFVRRPWKMAVTGTCFVVVLLWWFSLQPSNNRDWLPDVVELPYADINGSQVVIHNIRNCDYRTETDFTVQHYDKTFNLDQLRTADLYLVTWGSPHIAHTMISFGFTNGDYVCFSIECRKEKGEDYSALKGLFRQFELTYIIADERDVVRLRTNYRRDEEACLYRLQVTPEQGRKLFLDYVRRANELHERAEWYNALTDNCTTAIRMQRDVADRAPWDWRMLINGHLDKMLYEHGTIVTNLPFPELKKRPISIRGRRRRIRRWIFRSRSARDCQASAKNREKIFSKLLRVNCAGFSRRLHHAHWRGQSVAALGLPASPRERTQQQPAQRGDDEGAQSLRPRRGFP